MSLQEEIQSKAKEIQTDGYPISIGELINMYDENEIDVNPEFQRFFRWSEAQKSKLIESILLGIPIPPIFVSQRESGEWDVIDGLQRLSTIFEFVGILKNLKGESKSPLTLQATEFLPSLDGKVWENKLDPENSFSREERINFKRAKLDVKIIKATSDKDAKYELFQRINTGGSPLTYQEVRNCLFIMLNREFYTWLTELNSIDSFQNCIPITERQKEEQYDMELVVRYLVSKFGRLEKVRGDEDVHALLTEEMLYIIEENKIDQHQEKETFVKTFSYLDSLLSDDSFKKYDQRTNRYRGAFSQVIFEAIIVGISENIDKLMEINPDIIRNKIKDIFQKNDYNQIIKKRPVVRMKELTLFSRELFSNG